METAGAIDETIEVIRWSRPARQLPDTDVSSFFDAPLRRFSLFHYVTRRFSVPPHASHLSFRTLLSGAERYDLGARRFTLRAGDAVTLNPGERYASAIDGEATEALSLFIPEHEAERASAAARQTDARLLDDPDAGYGAHLPQTPRRAGLTLRRGVAGLRRALDGGGDEIVLERARMMLVDAFAEASSSRPLTPFARVERASVRDELMTRLIRARDFIEDAHGEGCTLGRLAAVACLSPYHFLRRFTEAFGETPVACARRARLRRAARQAAAGDGALMTARAAGYGDLGSFRRAWRRAFGAEARPPF